MMNKTKGSIKEFILELFKLIGLYLQTKFKEMTQLDTPSWPGLILCMLKDCFLGMRENNYLKEL
jgi:hypothetical protein